jgi:hypothetical protein
VTEPEALDLTREQPIEDELISLPQRSFPLVGGNSTPPPATKVSDPDERLREWMRGAIAIALAVTLFLVMVFTVIYVFSLSRGIEALSMDDLVAIIQGIGSALLTPLVGLIGAVAGFYYGGQATAQTAAQTAARMGAAGIGGDGPGSGTS